VVRSAGGAWFRTLVLVIGLLLFAWQTPLPWGWLWLLVPAAVALALLVSWRWGAWGVAVPALLFALTLAIEGPFSLWAWWIPVAGLTGTWMGLREEGGGPPSGQRAWMLLPLLLLAAIVPWMVEYPAFVEKVEATVKAGDAQVLEWARQLGYQGDRLQAVERGISEGAVMRHAALPRVMPSVLFVWMAMLVVAGRGLASRLAGVLRWPELSRGRLADWRLPDGAIWIFILGLAIVVLRRPEWDPTAWTLLGNVGLGYCVQGIAVVESLLLARGVSPSIIVLTLLFVFAMATPVFVLAAACVGLSDVWLDYRRLESDPAGE